MHNKLLKIAEVAERLDITIPRAYEMAREGVLPVVRLGRQIRIHPEKLEEWLLSGGQALPGGWRRD